MRQEIEGGRDTEKGRRMVRGDRKGGGIYFEVLGSRLFFSVGLYGALSSYSHSGSEGALVHWSRLSPTLSVGVCMDQHFIGTQDRWGRPSSQCEWEEGSYQSSIGWNYLLQPGYRQMKGWMYVTQGARCVCYSYLINHALCKFFQVK